MTAHIEIVAMYDFSDVLIMLSLAWVVFRRQKQGRILRIGQ